MRTPAIILLGLLILGRSAFGADDAAPVYPLWPDGAPGSGGRPNQERVRITATEHEHVVTGIHQPTLTVFLPTFLTNTRAGVVIIPGGGHRELWLDHEGYNVAKWLAARGVAGFVLKYRLAHEPGANYRVDVESLADVQRAIRFVRAHVADWHVDPNRVGVIGFSAGGELAALSAARFGPAPQPADDIDRQDDKPSFQALMYPGNAKSIAPTKDSPPAFLVCGYDDRPEISEELARVYLRFKAVGVPAELHIYTGVGHGFGLRASNHAPVSEWPDRFREWLNDRGFLR